jgi:lactoylglutathione lyase
VAATARAIGINHVALEVGDVDEALAFYGRVLRFELRGRAGRQMAFIDLGDQFLALSASRERPPDAERHLGLVVDDVQGVREALVQAGADILPGRGLSFRDPWGNRVEVVQYDAVQYTKDPAVLRAMGAGPLPKTEAALEELRAKGVVGSATTG